MGTGSGQPLLTLGDHTLPIFLPVSSPVGGHLHRKWKADKKSVHSLCCYGDNTTLLTAGRTIKIWNLSDYSLTKASAAWIAKGHQDSAP